jgi:hypothetical protein
MLSSRSARRILADECACCLQSKKIAQLTKVIYLLNTKNDEHEYEMKGLEDAYEADIDQVSPPRPFFCPFRSVDGLIHRMRCS